VNKKFWDGLPADIRTQLEGAMKDATRYTNAIAQQENDNALDSIKKAGKTTIYIPTAKEKAEWRKAMLPVRKEMESRIGTEVLKAVDKETAALGYK
jgi:C4-dicarboxylate-binding protein DctP